MAPQKVILIGTSHTYQREENAGAEEFRQFVDGLVAEHGVAALGEEMSVDALTKSVDGQLTSVCAAAASAAGIAHVFCDPSLSDRQAMGIAQENDIRIQGFHEHDGAHGAWANAKVRESHDKREKIWLGHVRSTNKWPFLFVCGANHLGPFRTKLAAAGFKVKVEAADWSPISKNAPSAKDRGDQFEPIEIDLITLD